MHVWTHAEARTVWVDVCPHTWSYVCTCGRMPLQLYAIVKYMLIMLILRDVAAESCSSTHILIQAWFVHKVTCAAEISVSAVIEINVFDYNSNARARALCECSLRPRLKWPLTVDRCTVMSHAWCICCVMCSMYTIQTIELWRFRLNCAY